MSLKHQLYILCPIVIAADVGLGFLHGWKFDDWVTLGVILFIGCCIAWFIIFDTPAKK